MPTKPKFKDIPQPHKAAPPFDSYDKTAPMREAVGGVRVEKILEAGFIQSTNWPDAGWRLTPHGIEFAGDTTVFPPDIIPLIALENIATGKILGNASGSTGPVTVLGAGAGISISGGAIASTITQYTDNMAKDAAGAALANTNTIHLTYTGGTHTITADAQLQMSIASDSSGIKLSGDATTPGNNFFYGTNGSGTKGWQELPAKTMFLLSTTTGIDGKATGTTTLYTVPTGRTAIITHAVIRATTASSATVPPTLGIGIAAGEDDIFPSTAITGLTVTTKTWEFGGGGLMAVGASTNVIKLGIDTGATATTLTLAVDLFGYLI